MMARATRAYLPAAGHDWFLPLYDPLVKLLGGDAARKKLLVQAALQPGHRILDIGCGTGSLAVMIKRLHPDVEIAGLDPDAKALTRARQKADKAGVSVKFDQGFSDNLPYPDASYDRVFSSFMFHHLEAGDKEETLREVRRVLKPGGLFCLLDFEKPESGGYGLARLLHSSHRLKDNSDAQIIGLMRRAGFTDPEKAAQGTMLFLRVAYHRAAAPAVDVGPA